MSTETRTQSPIRLGLLAVLALAIVGAGVWAVMNERPGDDVAASLGPEELPVAHLNDILRSNPANQVLVGGPGEDGSSETQEPATGSALEAADEVTGWLITQAVTNELQARGAPVNEDHLAQAGQLTIQGGIDPESAFGERSVRFQSVVLALQEYTDATARAASVDVAVPEWICSSHILLETEEDALAVIAELDAGMEFAEAAREFSTGPSGPDGGDLGCSSVERLVVEFVNGARASGPGTVSPPVQSQFGWHVIEVRAIGELTAENFPEVDAQTIETERFNAEAAARQAIADELFTEVLEVARAEVSADGFVDPRFGTWVPEQAFVAPPSGVMSGAWG